MRTTVAFIKWAFLKLGDRLLDIHNEFKRGLIRETGLTLFLWLLMSAASTVAVLFVIGGFQYFTGIEVPIKLWFLYMALCVFYMLYTCFTVMYSSFKEERAQLFETIKRGN